jgi:hypothetical protein
MLDMAARYDAFATIRLDGVLGEIVICILAWRSRPRVRLSAFVPSANICLHHRVIPRLAVSKCATYIPVRAAAGTDSGVSIALI